MNFQARTVGNSGYVPNYEKELEVFDECSSADSLKVTLNPLIPLSLPPYFPDASSGEMSVDDACLIAEISESTATAHTTVSSLSSGFELIATCSDIDMIEVSSSFTTVISRKEDNDDVTANNNDVTGIHYDVTGIDFDVSSIGDDSNNTKVDPREDAYASGGDIYSVASTVLAGTSSAPPGAGRNQNSNQVYSIASGYVLDEQRPLLSSGSNSSNEGSPHIAMSKNSRDNYICKQNDDRPSDDSAPKVEFPDNNNLTMSMEKFCADKLAATIMPNSRLPGLGYSKLSHIHVSSMVNPKD